MAPALLYVPLPSLRNARILAQRLLEEKHAACVNILPQVSSVYWWNGGVTESEEVVCMVKTLVSHVPNLMDRIQELHPDQCPVMLSIKVDAVPPSVLTWLSESLGVKP